MRKKSIIILSLIVFSILGFGVNLNELETYIKTQQGFLAKQKSDMFVRMRKFNLPPRVQKAFEDVQRELFTFNRESMAASKANVRQAYQETPLAIGYGQTISSPNMVAIMTKMAIPDPNDVVLEIGTGSGYQGAILSKLCKKVYTIEIVKPLSQSTEGVFKRYNYTNVVSKAADGYFGWKEHGPFDKILVTCATNHIPPALIQQLKRGGIMLVPVGHPYKTQQLIEVTKLADGKIKTRRLMHVRFVPMTGRAMQGAR